MELTSPNFGEGGAIPSQFTCDGNDTSPPLRWSGVPDQARSLALVVDDPDAPAKVWVHWVLYDIPPNVNELPQGVGQGKTLDNGAAQGTNDFQRLGYGGPCPPSGTHHYRFTLYALDQKLNLPPGATKEELLKAMERHIIAQDQLTGQYARGR
jgi:hypothetical protein